MAAACIEPQELAPFIPEDFSYSPEANADDDHGEYNYIGERDYNSAECIEFCKQYSADALAKGLRKPTTEELNKAYARSQREYEDEDPWLERDRAERAAEIAADCRVFSASLSSHVQFDKIHEWCGKFAASKWFPSHREIEFIADVALAARFALRNLPVHYAMYQIWLDGGAADIPAHVLARSPIWYDVKRLVGDELKTRRLDGTYFNKKRVRVNR